MSHLLDSLTEAQQTAVQHIDGPMLMLAGPGSGKTRVVTHRIANLIEHGVPPWQILALTFTNKAAQEMAARVERLAPNQRVWVSTFHRFCARLLRQYAGLVGLPENYTIYDTGDSLSALKQTLDELDLDLTHMTPERVYSAISWAKNSLILPEQYEARPGHPVGLVVAKVYPAYQARLLRCGAVDFDDLLLHVATMLRENSELRAKLDARYRYILVDEYQDTNLAQYTIVRALSIDYPNLSVTGDPDQSIYGWRGANLNNILDFEQDFPNVRVVRLEQNYRSTKRILRVADRLIGHNKKRKQKGLFTHNDEGPAVRLTVFPTQRNEAEDIAARIARDVHTGQRRPRDFAIFYRMNALSRSLEFALRDFGVPYQMVNGVEFYQRKEIKDVLAYLHLLNNPRNDVALLRIFNTPPRGIGKTTINHLRNYADRRGKTLLEAARESGLVESINKRAAVAVAKFVAMFDRLQLISQAAVEEIMGHVLTESGYQEMLKASESEEDAERLANIEELLTAARQFDEQQAGTGHLETFLEEVCLVNDTDAWESENDRVTMMTLHGSKGLEFPVVFIIALEEGLLPHERSRESPDQLEEERRLLFVGLTRAEQELHLSLSRYREFRGQRKMSVPSQFCMELPHEDMEVVELNWASAIGAGSVAAVHDDVHEESPDEVHHHAGDDAFADRDHDEAIDTAHEDQLDGTRLGDAHEDAGHAGDDSDLDFPFSAAATPVAPVATHGAAPAPAAIPAAPARPVVPPDEFFLGMRVQHPNYGLGKVVALSGNGVKRTATVNFASMAGTKKFVIAHSPLQPVGGGK